MSEDGGRTWIASRTFNPAHYVYQCMTILPDGTLGLLWEREMQGLYFTRIPLEWLEPPRSDDSSYLDTRPPATLSTQEDGRRPRTPRIYNVQGGHRWVPALHAYVSQRLTAPSFPSRHQPSAKQHHRLGTALRPRP